MKKGKKNIFIIAIILLILIIFGLFLFRFINRGELIELTASEVIYKIENKESFVLCMSSTKCDHCASYKPKLERVSKKYNLDTYYIDINLYSEEELNNLKKYISVSKSTPTTALIKNGEEGTASSRIIGNASSEQIVEKLKKNGFIK